MIPKVEEPERPEHRKNPTSLVGERVQPQRALAAALPENTGAIPVPTRQLMIMQL